MIRVEGDDNNIWFTVPDDAEEPEIEAVVQAQDVTPIRLNPNQLRPQEIEELLGIGRSNWSASRRNELLELWYPGCSYEPAGTRT